MRSGHRRTRVLLLAFLLPAVLAVTGAEEEGSPPAEEGGPPPTEVEGSPPAEGRLEAIEGEIRRERVQVEEIEAEEKSILETLQTLDRDVESVREEMWSIEAQMAEAQGQLARAQQSLAVLEKDRQAEEGRLHRRLVALYKFGRGGHAKALFSSGSVESLERKNRFLSKIIRDDFHLLQKFSARANEIEGERAATRTERVRLSGLRDAQAEASEELESRRVAKHEMLAKVRNDKSRRLAAIRELEAASEALQREIDRISEAEASTAGGSPGPTRSEAEVPVGAEEVFSSRKGRLLLPAEGAIVRPFGLEIDPDFGTRTHRKGIDIEAEYGAPIHAVHGGRVLYAGWFRGYGKMMIIDHGEKYYSLYAHASELLKGVGESVQAGEVIGRVGDTGSLEGPMLYFEVRYHGKPVDPEGWLSRSAETGRLSGDRAK